MIARHQDHRCYPTQPHERIFEQLYGLYRWNGTVIDVSCDDNGIHFLLLGRQHEPVDELALMVQEVHGQQIPSQMPIRCMEESHATCPFSMRG